MPATNYNWPFNEQQPIFQVYGTKRKNCAEESSQDVVEEVETKRRCTEARQSMEEEEGMTDSMDITGNTDSEVHQSQTVQSQISYPYMSHSQCSAVSHTHHHHQAAMHSNTSIQDLAQHHLQVTMNNRVPPLPDATGDHMNNNTIVQTEDGQELNNNIMSQNNMLMDLNEGVYSTATLPLNPQTDAEYEAACNMVAAMEGEGAPDPQQYSMSYCDPQCVGGHRSPNSGRVRCLCRPSWEGLMDVRPYISDYY
ncbi:uncharacterized protein LOC123535563 isoform X2 [Mercenaria mercenaria]|uniref:uncharacterized protein LOC123535563 isoform X2 n=1 Tax=Mercenaria mercenaria TaxID=6596 RepID=UPI001E1E1416|nr:uncharacterized protein LOC123535563 isoform X2 [Mercenaria mercenaria]